MEQTEERTMREWSDATRVERRAADADTNRAPLRILIIARFDQITRLAFRHSFTCAADIRNDDRPRGSHVF